MSKPLNQPAQNNTKHTPMTQAAAARIQSATAKAGGDTGKGTFPATAQSAAAKNNPPNPKK